MNVCMYVYYIFLYVYFLLAIAVHMKCYLLVDLVHLHDHGLHCVECVGFQRRAFLRSSLTFVSVHTYIHYIQYIHTYIHVHQMSRVLL